MCHDTRMQEHRETDTPSSLSSANKTRRRNVGKKTRDSRSWNFPVKLDVGRHVMTRRLTAGQLQSSRHQGIFRSEVTHIALGTVPLKKSQFSESLVTTIFRYLIQHYTTHPPSMVCTSPTSPNVSHRRCHMLTVRVVRQQVSTHALRSHHAAH